MIPTGLSKFQVMARCNYRICGCLITEYAHVSGPSDSVQTTQTSLVIESPTNPQVMFHCKPEATGFHCILSKPQITGVAETSLRITSRVLLQQF